MHVPLLCRIEAPHFVCGFDLVEDTVKNAAPIIRYMNGWTRDRVRAYCAKKSWIVQVVCKIEGN